MSGGEPTKKRRVLSGMRPTGRLHIGNYFGALANWVKLQNDPANECFFFVADWHSLTSDYADTSQIAQNTIEVMTDFLAAGLDPKKSVIFLQSSVPEHAELHLLLSMITPLGWLERVPTYKEQIENMKGKDLQTYGFLGYPVLMATDIVMYGEPDRPLVVPVGEDQVAHVELNREIVRRFNFQFGFEITESFFEPYNPTLIHAVLHRIDRLADLPPAGRTIPKGIQNDLKSSIRQRALEVGLNNFRNFIDPEENRFFRFDTILSEPEAMLTEAKRVPGTDGRKMSKSYGNAIELGESDESIRAKTKVMMTDPARKRRTDKGNPDICPVYDWHKLFSPPEVLKWSAEGCRSAGIGCIECKGAMADHLIKWIAPIRERRVEFGAHPDRVLQLLDEGSKRAQVTARATMERVREAVFHWKEKRDSILAQTDTATKKHSGAGD
jgi:tryptophanyl-tRNA synthetase